MARLYLTFTAAAGALAITMLPACAPSAPSGAGSNADEARTASTEARTTAPVPPTPPAATDGTPAVQTVVDAQGFVVLELFTSQGCSSCPPADVLLAELSDPETRPELIPLSFHVDYWNDLGWADPFSSADWSDRQRAYAATWNATRIYTPQLVVQGSEHVVGSDRDAVDALLADAAVTALPIDATRWATEIGIGVEVDVDADDLETLSGDVAAFAFAVTPERVETDVERGENGGRTLSHARVVRAVQPLGVILRAGEDQTLVGDLALPDGLERADIEVVVIAQRLDTGAILGAARF